MNLRWCGAKSSRDLLAVLLTSVIAIAGAERLALLPHDVSASGQGQEGGRPSVSASPTGTLRGTVRIESAIQSKSMAVNIYSQRSTSGPSPTKSLAEGNEVGNVVVYLEGTFPSRLEGQPWAEPDRISPPPVMRQFNETFVPHVLPIVVGALVEFPNSDPFFHNVFSLSGPKSFDLGRYPQGQKRTVRFDKKGMVKVFCHIHSHMSAVILVFDHPHFAVPDPKGQYVLPNLPPGNFTLVGWHERLKPIKKTVTVRAGESITVDLIL
jgi:plastocyanin